MSLCLCLYISLSLSLFPSTFSKKSHRLCLCHRLCNCTSVYHSFFFLFSGCGHICPSVSMNSESPTLRPCLSVMLAVCLSASAYQFIRLSQCPILCLQVCASAELLLQLLLFLFLQLVCLQRRHRRSTGHEWCLRTRLPGAYKARLGQQRIVVIKF